MSIATAVRPEPLDLTSRCTEWTVRQAIEHLVPANEGLLALLTGGEPRAADLGDDPGAAFADFAARMLAALREAGALERTVEMPSGLRPVSAMAGFGLVDLLVHGWDVAKATGQPTDFALEPNEAAPTVTRPALAPFGRSTMTAPAPEAAGAADRPAAFLGRAV